VKTSRHQNVARRKRRIMRRLRPRTWTAQPRPMYRARNVQYEHGDRIRGLASGGIGAMHRLAQHTGLVTAIDQHVEVLKVHLPYHESDHVLGIAYNVLCGGTCLQDIEHRRQDEVYLDALGAQRIPDPTTAGDFCRRFDESAIEALQAAINETRVRVWRAQPAAFFDEAVIDADGTVAETTGECKDGMDIAYDGMWGYHPLVVSLANTGEPLYLVNRSGNRPSSEGAAARFDQARVLCQTAGFAGSPSAAIPISARRSTWTDGMPPASGSCLGTTRARISSARPTRCGPARGPAWCGARRTRSRLSRASGP
jgi:hypothetical protein